MARSLWFSPCMVWCRAVPPRVVPYTLPCMTVCVLPQWRGQAVAVKEITLPQESEAAAAAAAGNDEDRDLSARRILQEKMQDVALDFVTEVAVNCDLLHPNLVQLLGYSTTPTLRIVQEMMLGGSVDKALYVDSWRPSNEQVVSVALDVAEGMNYLHTAFCRGGSAPPVPHRGNGKGKGRQQGGGPLQRARRDGNGTDDDDANSLHMNQAVIHRDLKTPNLLLAAPPPMDGSTAGLLVKITDFGLSRDKKLVEDMQTGTTTAVECA